MTSAGSERLESVVEALRAAPGRTAILTDIDGTIAPIVERPDRVSVPRQAREALARLAERYALVACISGRRASEARQIVDVEGLTYSGNHGMETLSPDTGEMELELNLRGHADAAASFVDHLGEARLAAVGMRREDKGPIQALHWRGAEDELAAEAEAREIAAEAEDCGLEPHWGRKVLEIRPPGGGGKGAAIAALLSRGNFETAVYAGDDRTDIDAFRRLRELHAETDSLREVFCVGIDSPEGPPGLRAHSDLVLESPDHWIETLERLAAG